MPQRAMKPCGKLRIARHYIVAAVVVVVVVVVPLAKVFPEK